MKRVHHCCWIILLLINHCKCYRRIISNMEKSMWLKVVLCLIWNLIHWETEESGWAISSFCNFPLYAWISKHKNNSNSNYVNCLNSFCPIMLRHIRMGFNKLGFSRSEGFLNISGFNICDYSIAVSWFFFPALLWPTFDSSTFDPFFLRVFCDQVREFLHQISQGKKKISTTCTENYILNNEKYIKCT